MASLASLASAFYPSVIFALLGPRSRSNFGMLCIQLSFSCLQLNVRYPLHDLASWAKAFCFSEMGSGPASGELFI
ncbi:hypothetical protein BDV10DRAFT_167320 [Aspergillus recurvatus]